MLYFLLQKYVDTLTLKMFFQFYHLFLLFKFQIFVQISRLFGFFFFRQTGNSIQAVNSKIIIHLFNPSINNISLNLFRTGSDIVDEIYLKVTCLLTVSLCF